MRYQKQLLLAFLPRDLPWRKHTEMCLPENTFITLSWDKIVKTYYLSWNKILDSRFCPRYCSSSNNNNINNNNNIFCQFELHQSIYSDNYEHAISLVRFGKTDGARENDLKGQGYVTVNKPVISRIYVVAHTLPLCSVLILVDWVHPK